MNQSDLRDQQERSAQHHVRWLKALYVSLAVGAVFLMLPRAVPWFSSGVPETAMGRPVGGMRGFQLEPLIWNAALHLLLATVYGFILAMLVFRFPVKTAIPLGGAIGLALYALNFILFRVVIGSPDTGEFPVALTHLAFGLIFSGAYKAVSVPDADKIP
jgi:hypothetical protein